MVDEHTALHAWAATLELADLYALTVCDAACLELAQRLRLPLASYDHELMQACKSAGVPIFPDRSYAQQ